MPRSRRRRWLFRHAPEYGAHTHIGSDDTIVVFSSRSRNDDGF
jgi:hypothetical protein